MPNKKPQLPELHPERLIPFGGKPSQEAARAIDGLNPGDPRLDRLATRTLEDGPPECEAMRADLEE